MPRSTREWAKRKLQESIDNITWAGYHCNEVHKKYNEPHPEIGKPIEDVMTTLELVINLIEQIRNSF